MTNLNLSTVTTANLSALPAIDSVKISQNILSALRCERASLPAISIGSKVFHLELIGVYNTTEVKEGQALQSTNRTISHYTINRSDNGAVLATLYPNKETGFKLERKNESVSIRLLDKAMNQILDPAWLVEKIANGELKSGILGIALIFSVVKFATGSNFIGEAIPITDDQDNWVMAEYNRCMAAIQDLVSIGASSENVAIEPAKIAPPMKTRNQLEKMTLEKLIAFYEKYDLAKPVLEDVEHYPNRARFILIACLLHPELVGQDGIVSSEVEQYIPFPSELHKAA